MAIVERLRLDPFSYGDPVAAVVTVKTSKYAFRPLTAHLPVHHLLSPARQMKAR